MLSKKLPLKLSVSKMSLAELKDKNEDNSR
jgi:hypothetical protein